jgi:hypothetical protein
MALSDVQVEFAKRFYAATKVIAPKYNLVSPEAITAQACVESRYGASKLSKNYHNYFGMKCGSKWTGKSVNMNTKEEYKAGVITNIKDNFRAYDTLELGIEGYCKFITGYSRYSNLLGCKDPIAYFQRIKSDGWATSSTYVSTLRSVYLSLKSAGVFNTPATNEPAQVQNTSCPFKIGSTYTVVASSLNVRQSPSTDSKVVKSYPKGTRCTCKDVFIVNTQTIWMKTPSGWIAALYNGKQYVK